MRTAEIFVKDSNSKKNRDLCLFIEKNLSAIITKGSIRIKFKIVRLEHVSALRAQGIKKYPTMLMDGKQYVDTPHIIAFIQNAVQTSQTVAAKKTDEETLNDFYKEAIGGYKKDADGKIVIPKDDDDDDDGEKQKQQLLERTRKAAEQRNLNGFNGKSRDTRNVPAAKAPIRDVEMDDDTEDVKMPPITNKVRENNVGDPKRTASSMVKGVETDDDRMLMSLLDKIGPDD